MLIKQAFRYELRPNNEQRGLLVRHCGVARFAWNWALAHRIELYRTREGKERYTSAITQHRELNALKKTEFPWMYEVSKCAPQEALRDLDQAYANMFRRIKENREARKRGEKAKKIGRPRFKKKGVHDSFTLTGSIKVGEKSIQLPRLGVIRTKERTSKFRGQILSATVSREADRWYCSLGVSYSRPDPQPVIGEIVGIDLGLNSFVVIYDGHEFDKKDAPKPLKNRLKRLQRLSKQQSRKQKKSQNRKNANLALARCHRRVKNVRKDFLNKLTTELAKTKPVICIEDLAVKNMVRNRRLARSIADVGWGDFRRQLEYKTLWHGSRLVVIPRFEPSSKTCHACGTINDALELSDRKWICQSCGAFHDRDENAAVNIRNCGIRLLSTGSSSGIEACGVDVRPRYVGATYEEAGRKRVQ